MRDERSSRLRDQVMEFHALIGQPIAVYPTIIPADRVRLRAALIAEEFFETMEAMLDLEASENLTDTYEGAKRMIMAALRVSPAKVDLPALVDGLADLDYVVEGTRIEFGVNGTPVADEVHAANMRKADGPVDEHGKKRKPPGWVGPDIERVLREQGWRG